MILNRSWGFLVTYGDEFPMWLFIPNSFGISEIIDIFEAWN